MPPCPPNKNLTIVVMQIAMTQQFNSRHSPDGHFSVQSPATLTQFWHFSAQLLYFLKKELSCPSNPLMFDGVKQLKCKFCIILASDCLIWRFVYQKKSFIRITATKRWWIVVALHLSFKTNFIIARYSSFIPFMTCTYGKQ